DTALGVQGILSATERELMRPGHAGGAAFMTWAADARHTLDAHSLGTIGARNLKAAGAIAASVRLLSRPALSLGWTSGTQSFCMAGDPICGGSLLSKLCDPTCRLLPGAGHVFAKYAAVAGA
ncbi:unnamed protein product, partial [Phaeothamnion confervicola]